MNTNIEFYIEAIKEEVNRLNEGKFTGNIDFKINFKDGSVGNMNIVLSKSIKA